MNKLFMILAILLSLSIAMPILSHADSNKYISLEELEGLSTNARNEIVKKRLKELKDSQKASQNIVGKVANVDPKNLEAWANLISTTIKTVCNDLSITVNEFAKTNVGKITMCLIVYKVIGKDLKGIIFGILLWIVTMPLIVMSFVHFHTRYKSKTLDKDGKVVDISYTKRYHWESGEAKGFSALAHTALFVGFTILCAVMVTL